MPYSQLPQPCMEGDKINIKISKKEYQAGLERLLEPPSLCRCKIQTLFTMGEEDLHGVPIKVVD